MRTTGLGMGERATMASARHPAVRSARPQVVASGLRVLYSRSVEMPPELIVVNGPQAGTRFALDKDNFFIGRAPNSAIVLPEPEIAWRHCQIRLQAGRFLVSDLRTSSGTYVNGMRSAERWLEDGIKLGSVKRYSCSARVKRALLPNKRRASQQIRNQYCWRPARWCFCSGHWA